METKKPLIEAARGRTPERHPVWFMRQAGRYLPEYRKVREGVEFTELCRTPKLASEVTLQPLRRYDLDAAIIFSDILILPMVMGQSLTFGKGHGPQLDPPVRSAADLKKLKRPDAERDVGFVGEAIGLTKEGLGSEQAMLGFAGAPMTVASYMIEGGGSKLYTEVKKLLFKERDTFTQLLEFIADATVDYLAMQVKAGADAVMLFDTWAGELTPADYRSSVFPATKSLMDRLKQTVDVPVIYFPGQGSDRMAELEGLPADVISVDWRSRLSTAQRILKETGLSVTLQGNLDPQVLVADEETVRQRTRAVLEEVKSCAPRAHIFNTGHGLPPHTPPEALGWVVDELRKAPGL